MSDQELNVVVVGATGLVGSELLEALARKRFPIASLKLFASINSAGERIPFMDDEISVEAIAGDFHEGADLVFFTVHPLVSYDLAEAATNDGAFVIDASNAFRLDPEVPLVVPEVNAEALAGVRDGKGIVASPSAAAVAVALVAAPLQRRFGVKSVAAVTAYGSTGGGRRGFEEHSGQSIGVFSAEEIVVEKFQRRTAFNIFPRVGEFNDDGATGAEQELIDETPRILGVDLPIAATAMQVPVFCGLAMVLTFELAEDASLAAFRDELGKAPGVLVVDDPAEEAYPDTLLAMEQDDLLVGRIRKDPTRPRSFTVWVSCDNLRKGSALNLVGIAELLAKFGDDLKG